MEAALSLEPSAVRRRAALELLASREPELRRTARRYSLCHADADDAFQRAVEILLTRAPNCPARSLGAWMRVVTRREALALRRTRERLLGHAPGNGRGREALGDANALVELLPCPRATPEQRLEHRERVTDARQALATLKGDERTALGLQAAGYSYVEICRITGWSYTKVNRSLAEGRARLRSSAGRHAPRCD